MTQKNSSINISRSLWNRVVPTRIRHNIGLIFGSLILISLVGYFLGTLPLQPIVFSDDKASFASNIVNNIEGEIDLFDLSQAHSISLQVSDIDYETMLSEFQRFGEKAWIQADAVIDGTFINSVGIRLKGNSTLMSLNNSGPGFGDGEEAGNFENNMLAEIAYVSPDEPSTLPLLMSFSEFAPGRGYQGRAEIAIRSSRKGGATLNEGVALQLIRESGQISQKFSWVTFNINDTKTATRIIVENPDQNYASSLGLGDGVIYKSRSTNTFTYHGDDQTLYLEDFSQINALGSRDLKPVISFLKWIESASDEEFDNELENRLDIKSFAKYVVTHDLLNNFDDMAGPGRNFLFRYDINDEKFTVISWDLNVAIIGLQGILAGIEGGAQMAAMIEGMMTGGGPPNFAELTGGEGAPGMPEGFAGMPPPNAGGFPEGAAGFPAEANGLPEGISFDDFAENANENGINRGNLLKERFVASEKFVSEIIKAREELYQLWFGSGRAIELLNEYAELAPLSERLTKEERDKEVVILTQAILSVD